MFMVSASTHSVTCRCLSKRTQSDRHRIQKHAADQWPRSVQSTSVLCTKLVCKHDANMFRWIGRCVARSRTAVQAASHDASVCMSSFWPLSAWCASEWVESRVHYMPHRDTVAVISEAVWPQTSLDSLFAWLIMTAQQLSNANILHGSVTLRHSFFSPLTVHHFAIFANNSTARHQRCSYTHRTW